MTKKTAKNPRFNKKYKAIQEVFKHKFDVEGKRTEVIFEELEEQFFLGRSRLEEIVRMDLKKF